jgi:hypothetical protein
MRIFCESCNHPQPAGWKRGDFCVDCGQVAKRETRCYWCLHFTPEGKFCRKCGAGLVADELFGAARMLKDAGVDRFSIPPRLAEMDPEQIDTFTSIYQQHAAAMWRHLDDLAIIQKELVQKHWAAKLETELLPQLPWPDDKLEKMRMPHAVTADQMQALQQIREHSPFDKTRLLATLALAKLGDSRTYKAVYREAFCSGDGEIELEAAYTLTHWRCFYGSENGYWMPMLPEGGARQICDVIRNARQTKHRAVRMGLLGMEPAPKELLDDSDRDLAFMAALARGDSERLANDAGSSEALRRYAVASKLIDVGLGMSSVAAILPVAPRDHQYRLLWQLQQSKKGYPELRRALFQILEEHRDGDIRGKAGTVLCQGCPPHEALEVARLSGGDSRVVQSLIQTAKLPSETLRQLGQFLVDSDRFSDGQFGMSEAAKKGSMPVDFVPKAFVGASAECRDELLRFAGRQLEEYEDEELHRFVMRVAFGEFGTQAPDEAWSVLHRWYRRSDAAARGPISFSLEFGERFFGSFPAFLRAFIRMLDPKNERGSFGGDYLAELVRYPQEGIMRRLGEFEKEAVELERALTKIVDNTALSISHRGDCLRMLGAMGEHLMFRDRVRALLKRMYNSELQGACMIATDALNALIKRGSPEPAPVPMSGWGRPDDV